ncbi:MAG: ATP-binding protein [Bacteroidetes bacterium]|nr:ATP-binding protein [Bacteroidota bacterium]MBU1677787.1 ATP-binding protein [Bacteroidota bacterium]MBU2507210.1 ATP-binding protein [Bacteroidota bacterium]
MPTHSFIIESEYHNVTDILADVRAFVLGNNVTAKESADIEVCMLEAMNNVIRHSYKGKSGFPIEIKVSVNSDQIDIEIIDSGISREKFDKPTLDFDPDDIENLPEGGMGLFIIDQIMTSTNYEVKDGKNYYTMSKKLIH